MPTSLLLVSLLLAAANPPEEVPLPARMEDLRRTLAAGDFARAAELAQALTRAEPDLREAWEILAVLKQVPGEPVPPEIQQHLAWKPPTPKAPTAGTPAYVVATSLRLRTRADANAPVAGAIGINTPVQVKSVAGDWAELGVTFPAVVLSFADEGPPATGTGWTPWRFLSPTPLTPGDLVRDALVLEKQGFLPEAARLLERAVALEPGDEKLAAGCKRVALAAHQFDLVARLATPPAPGGEITATTEVFAACRGVLEVSSTVDGNLPKARLEKSSPNACARLEAPWGTCSEAEPFAGAPFTEQSACDAEYRGPQSEGACRAAINAQMADYRRKLARWDAESTKLTQRISALREVFPGGSAARFDLTLPTAAKARRLWAYRLPYSTSSCQDTQVAYDWAKLQLSARGIDAPLAAGPFTVWVELPSPISALVGLVVAGDAKEAGERARSLEKDASTSDPGAIGRAAPAPNVVLPTPVCVCGGTPAYEW